MISSWSLNWSWLVVLIESDWNLNDSPFQDGDGGDSVLIESDWNLNPTLSL